jgi:tetratricopeptide (TPR) repeat protein
LPDVNDEAVALIKDVPQSIEEKQLLLDQIEIALYEVGKIYNLQLEENDNAIKRFKELLERFPQTQYEPEVLYQLFLLFKDQPTVSTNYGNELKNKYPESIYAKLVDNPLYREEDFAANELLKRTYKKLYRQYEYGDYENVMYSVDSLIKLYPDYNFTDNVALLRVLCIGKTEEDYNYQYALGAFLDEYPESDLKEYVQKLLITTENFQKERYNSAAVRFIKDFNQKHYFILTHNINDGLSDSLLVVMDRFIAENKITTLNTGNLILNNESTMTMVNWFPSKNTAEKFVDMFETSLPELPVISENNIRYFIITEDNFEILYKTKDPESYYEFFNEHY